jgi:hypothetical protein
VADAIFAAVRDPKTSVGVRALFGDALVVFGGQLDPAKADSLEGALVDSLIANLADAKSQNVGGLLAQAAAAVSGRPGSKCASRTAEALTAAIRNPQTPLVFLKPLAAALARVSGQLTPKEASSHAHQAVDVLSSLWVARTAPLDRASLAEALAAVWTRLSPTEAADRAKRVAADLEEALRNSKAAPNETYRLPEALAAVDSYLSHAERVAHANSAADALITALRRPKNDLATTAQLSEGLVALCVHLDRPGVVRVADTLFTVLGDPEVQRFKFVFHRSMFKKVAARLDERDLQRLLEHPLTVGRMQRVILDVLGGSKKRCFRNTWDYLDWTASNRNGTDLLAPGSDR